MPTSTASSSPSVRSITRSGWAARYASSSVIPSAGSILCTTPPPATRSSERTNEASGPNATPLPCVAVDMTPANVWPS
jgi:hypothetical protein